MIKGTHVEEEREAQGGAEIDSVTDGEGSSTTDISVRDTESPRS